MGRGPTSAGESAGTPWCRISGPFRRENLKKHRPIEFRPSKYTWGMPFDGVLPRNPDPSLPETSELPSPHLMNSEPETEQLFQDVLQQALEDGARGQLKPFPHYLEQLPEGQRQDLLLNLELIEQDAQVATTDQTTMLDHRSVRRALHPTQIGRYRALRQLDEQGAMGTVLLARDPDLDCNVVLKTIGLPTLPNRDQGDRILRRMKQEAQALGQIQHPYVCGIRDVVDHHGTPVLVMPFVEGESLARILKRQRSARQDSSDSRVWPQLPRVDSHPSGQFSQSRDSGSSSAPAATSSQDAKPSELPDFLRFMERVAQGIQAAHDRNIVHRDLKPSNIMATPSGHPVIIDFGLALNLGTPSDLRQTQDGDSIGTPLYMSPEQIGGERDSIDTRTDIWALGVMLYEGMTGQLPFDGSVAQLRRQIPKGDPAPPRKLNPSISVDAEAVAMKCLEASPHRRYASAAALAEDLANIRNLRPVSARPLTPLRRFLRPLARHKLIVALTVGVAILGIALLVQWLREEDKTRIRSLAYTDPARFLEEGSAYWSDDVLAPIKEAVRSGDTRTFLGEVLQLRARGSGEPRLSRWAIPGGKISPDLLSIVTPLMPVGYRWAVTFTSLDPDLLDAGFPILTAKQPKGTIETLTLEHQEKALLPDPSTPKVIQWAIHAAPSHLAPERHAQPVATGRVLLVPSSTWSQVQCDEPPPLDRVSQSLLDLCTKPHGPLPLPSEAPELPLIQKLKEGLFHGNDRAYEFLAILWTDLAKQNHETSKPAR